MPQVTVYLDTATAKRVKAAAKAAEVSQSQWVGVLIRERTASTWPPAVAALAGTWADEPNVEIAREGKAADLPREPL